MTHEGVVEESFTGPSNAMCSCGFKGPDREGYVEARNDLLAHYKEQPE